MRWGLRLLSGERLFWRPLAGALLLQELKTRWGLRRLDGERVIRGFPKGLIIRGRLLLLRLGELFLRLGERLLP